METKTIAMIGGGAVLLLILCCVCILLLCSSSVSGYFMYKKMKGARVYKTYLNTDYDKQGDISKQDADAETCKTACDSIAGCIGFSHDGTTCHFKNNTIQKPDYTENSTFYYTGPDFTPVGPATMRDYKIYTNTDYDKQGDLKKQTGDVKTCKIACDKLADCTGFTHNGKECHFKNNTIKTPSYNELSTYYYTGTDFNPIGPAVKKS
jgi:hypothetical protein